MYVVVLLRGGRGDKNEEENGFTLPRCPRDQKLVGWIVKGTRHANQFDLRAAKPLLKGNTWLRQQLSERLMVVVLLDLTLSISFFFLYNDSPTTRHSTITPHNSHSMAAPAHYIRTIHTSFTAAHPHSSTAWANARTQHQYLHPFTSSINSHNSQIYQQHLQQQHNHHHHHHQQQQQQQQYQQQQQQHHQQQQFHLQPRKSTTSMTGGSAAPSPAGAGGRRRAGSIRMAPSSSPSPSPYMKFDPFADEPLSAPTSSPLAPSSQVNRISYTQNATTYTSRDHQHQHHHHHQQPSSSGSVSASSPTPITIHIPAAAPTEIKRYSTSPGRRIADFGSSNHAGSAGNGGSTFLGGSTIPSAVPTLNPSKIVAGILLNRVHAVGKPMRRRMPAGLSGPKQYVKSGLSSVVSIEA